MLLYTFIQMLPILVLTLLGYLMSRRHTVHVGTLVTAIADYLMPMLVFHSLYLSDLEVSLIAKLSGVTTFMVLSFTILSYGYSRIAGINPREFMPAVIVMNSGFLGIPLMYLWGGIPAMNIVVILEQVMTIYLFSLVIFIITGGVSRKTAAMVVKSPLLWAVLGGFTFRLAGIPVAQPILTILDFGGRAVAPLAAFTLGASFLQYKLVFNRHIAAGLILRFGGGFLVGLAGVSLFGLTGLTRTVVLVTAALPSAIFTAVLPIRYGVRSDIAGSMVVITTILGIVVIPVLFYLAG